LIGYHFRAFLMARKSNNLSEYESNLKHCIRDVSQDHAYHYFGSAIWFTRIGHAMAEAMTELLRAR